jgi:hypothetical protein
MKTLAKEMLDAEDAMESLTVARDERMRMPRQGSRAAICGCSAQVTEEQEANCRGSGKGDAAEELGHQAVREDGEPESSFELRVRAGVGGQEFVTAMSERWRSGCSYGRRG